MAVNLAPKISIDPGFEELLFAPGAILEDHRVNLNPDILQTTLARSGAPTARILEIGLFAETDMDLYAQALPDPRQAGYYLATGISPDAADPVSIPGLKAETDPANTLEELLNSRLHYGLGHVALLEKQSANTAQAAPNKWHSSTKYNVAAVVGGYCAVTSTMIMQNLSITGFARLSTSIALGSLAAVKITGADKSDGAKEFQTGQFYPPRILQIVPRQ